MAENLTEPLYTREFGSRPLQAFGVGFVFGVLLATFGLATGIVPVVFIVLGAACAIAGGVGYVRATKRIELFPDRVVKTSATGEKSYENAGLVLEQRGENVFVIKPRDSNAVISVLQDVDTDGVRTAFTAAGMEITQP
jgi:hypothetical protein